MNLNNSFKIGKGTVGDNSPTYIIAEMACAHDGDFDKAIKIIDAAAAAKANAIQLQIFQLEHVVTPTNNIHDILANITFTNEQWQAMVDHSKSKGLDVLVCTYDVPSVEIAVKLGIDGIKLNSSDLSNPEVIEAVAKTGLPFTLGTGASTLEEISNGLRLAAIHGAKDVVLMHGVQNFPTKPEDLNITKIQLLKETFHTPVGYHDHIDGDDDFGKMVDLIAIGMGASVIEKHITIDRSEKGLDFQAALEPAEFKTFVQNIRLAKIAYGSSEQKPFTESELKYRKFQKKSIVALRNLNVGETITRADVIFTRNNEPGVAPTHFGDFSGKKLTKEISQYDNISYQDIE